jgi:hypothetical protein
MKDFVKSTMTCKQLTAKLAVVGLFAALFVVAPFQAAMAQTVPYLGAAENFNILAGTAVTCTNSTVLGDVGVYPGTAVTQTDCTITGTIYAGDTVAANAQLDFDNAYANVGYAVCDSTLTGTLDGLTLTPGVYCFDAAATLTGVLTLDGQGDPNAVWIFKIGTLGTGALTATNFSVVMANDAAPCNVYWWVAEAATLTTSSFQGTVLAGAAITVTGGVFNGDALAKAAVTLTGATMTDCVQQGKPDKPAKSKCNQGVGNGPEGCDPGNSNQGNAMRSNDELGGTPGDPGRKGGNSSK